MDVVYFQNSQVKLAAAMLYVLLYTTKDLKMMTITFSHQDIKFRNVNIDLKFSDMGDELFLQSEIRNCKTLFV